MYDTSTSRRPSHGSARWDGFVSYHQPHSKTPYNRMGIATRRHSSCDLALCLLDTELLYLGSLCRHVYLHIDSVSSYVDALLIHSLLMVPIPFMHSVFE